MKSKGQHLSLMLQRNSIYQFVACIAAPDIFLKGDETLYNMVMNGRLLRCARTNPDFKIHGDGRSTEVIIYLYKTLFCNITDDNLQICYKSLLCLLESSFIRKNTVIAALATAEIILKDLGCKSTSANPHKKDYLIDVGRNLTYVLKALNSFLRICIESRYQVHRIILNSLLLTYMQLSMDNGVIDSNSSHLLFKTIINGIELMFILYEDAIFIKEDVLNIVNALGEYMDSLTGDFVHEAIMHVCLNIIPSNKLGIVLKKSVAYYSLMCCLNMNTVVLQSEITAHKVASILRENIEEFEARSCKELYSMLKLIDLCIPKSIEGDQESIAFEVILKIVSSVVNSKGTSLDDIGPKLLAGLLKILTSDWSRIICLEKKKRRLYGHNDHSSSDSEMDIY